MYQFDGIYTIFNVRAFWVVYIPFCIVGISSFANTLYELPEWYIYQFSLANERPGMVYIPLYLSWNAHNVGIYTTFRLILAVVYVPLLNLGMTI